MAPALTLPPTSNILHPFYRNLLPRLGINRNIPKELVEIPIYIRGFGMKSLEVEQCIESISLMISYFNSELPTNKLIKHSLELLQLETGYDSPILLSSYNKLSFLETDSWLKSLWYNLYHYKIVLHLPTIHHSQSHILNDKPIMQVAFELNTFTKEKILLINLVCINL